MTNEEGLRNSIQCSDKDDGALPRLSPTAILLGLLYCSPGLSQQFEIKGVPAGFESLTEPQTTAVDVVIGGDIVNTVMARYTPRTFEFIEPAQVLPLLPELTDQTKVHEALSGPLSSHADQACRSSKPKNLCGTLEPEIAGVIFDESRFRVEIFVSPRYLVQQQSRSPYLKPTNRELSYLLATSGSFSDNGRGEQDHNLLLANTLSKENKRIELDARIANQIAGSQLEKAIFVYESERLRGKAGLLESQTLQQVAQTNLLGVGLETTLDLLSNPDRLLGTDITLYLPRRSQVRVFRDDLLIGSENLAAGLQSIDTRYFPEGAYDVLIRITEAGGGEREERRFFAKASTMPPSDSPHYYAQVGMLQRPTTQRHGWDIETRGPLIAQVGSSIRVRPELGLKLATIQGSGKTFGGIGLFHLSPRTRTDADLMASPKGDLGVSLFLNHSLGKLSSSFSFSRLKIQDLSATASNEVTDEFRPLARSYTQTSANINHGFSWGQAGLKGQHRRDDIDKETYSIGPTLKAPVYRKGQLRADLSLEAGSTENAGYFIQAMLQITEIFNRHWDGSGHITTAKSKDAQGEIRQPHTLRAQVQWRDEDESLDDLSAEGAIENADNITSLQGKYERSGMEGRLATHGTVSNESDFNTNYGADFATSFAWSSDGLGYGGTKIEGSALIVELKGEPKGADFEVLVNSQKRGRAQVGRRVLVPLSAYATYDVRIASASSDILSYPTSAKSITLLPGTVVHLTWNVEKRVVLIAKIVDKNGAPMENARVDGASLIGSTGAEGWLQAEISTAIKELHITSTDGATCRVSLPTLDPKAQIQSLTENLLCQ